MDINNELESLTEHFKARTMIMANSRGCNLHDGEGHRSPYIIEWRALLFINAIFTEHYKFYDNQHTFHTQPLVGGANKGDNTYMYPAGVGPTAETAIQALKDTVLSGTFILSDVAIEAGEWFKIGDRLEDVPQKYCTRRDGMRVVENGVIGPRENYSTDRAMAVLGIE